MRDYQITGTVNSILKNLPTGFSAADRAAVGIAATHVLSEFMASRIAIYWTVADVLTVRPDLTDEQAKEVLETVYHSFDASLGVSWQTLEEAAEDTFGDKPVNQEEGDEEA